MRKIFKMYALLGTILLLTGCGSKEPQTLELALDSNQTTGYSWTLTQEEELFDVNEEYIVDENDENMTGVGGQQIFTLEPKEAGTTKLTFRYSRSWEEESDEDTVVSYTVKVSKSKQIEIQAATFAGGDDINELPTVPQPTIK
ncbi:MAG: protease inhibitor I42 family protein [Butyrivibrio sp.]|uniref:protease inhibitor I42 family protein n=1 Tax=Butyrivibrio sp. TaxID=28121 RepID=UPI0025E0EB23|nr:protease inhibitor I42 family protein [Butyrivibrio sp.]MCR5771733.1 protease inhibitor I42 family protein [Butyrivibrio sp.]